MPYGKGNTIETVKRSVVGRGSPGNYLGLETILYDTVMWIHDIAFLRTDRTIQHRVDFTVNYGLWLIIIYQYCFSTVIDLPHECKVIIGKLCVLREGEKAYGNSLCLIFL